MSRAIRAVARLVLLVPIWGGALFALGAAAAASPGQVSILPDEIVHDWRPASTLRLGETIGLLGHELGLALDSGHKLQSGADVPGGRLAPLRLKTDLALAVRAKPGLRPVPLRVAAPSDLEPLGGAPPLLGPGAEFLFWVPGDAGGEWAFARLLDVGSDHVRLELVECVPGCEAFERDPLGLEFEKTGALTWIASASHTPEGVPVHPAFAIDRRALGEASWTPMAEVAAPDADGVYRWLGVEGAGGSRLETAAVFEYRVQRKEPTPAPISTHVGATARHLPFQEEATTVAPGSSVHLVSGLTVESGRPAHVEVGRASPGAIVLTPAPGVRFSSVAFAAAKTEAKGEVDAGSWRLPDRADASWLSGKPVALRDGGEVAFLLESGLRGRISVTEIGSERWLFGRELSVDDTGLLPRPPAPPLKTVVEPAADPEVGRLIFSLAAPSRATEVASSDVSFVLEREYPLGSGDWQVLAMTGPGSSVLDVPRAFRSDDGTRLPLLRLRFRHRVSFGPDSIPGDSFGVLSSGSDSRLRDADLQAAIAAIASDSFVERLEARAVIEAIGDDARGALEAVAATSGGSPEGLAAMEILRAFDERSGGGARLAAQLRRHAIESLRSRGFPPESGEVDAWLGELPDGLASARADRRAHALLLLADRAERGAAASRSGGVATGPVGDDCERALAWADAVALVDPDEGVRWLARFLGEIGLTPSIASFESEGPAWLLAPERRSSAERLDFGWGEQPGTAEELRWQLEARPELASLELGFALSRLHASLLRPAWNGPEADGQAGRGDVSHDASAALFDYDAKTAELVLRLVERSRTSSSEEALLKAAEVLIPGERFTLDAWRSVTDRRLASPSAVVSGRERIALGSLDLGDVAAALLELDGHVGVDIVLAEGDWFFGEAGGSDPGGVPRAGAPALELRTDGVRLMAADGARVRLHAGLRIHARNIVLENLIVEQSVGQAITVLDGGHGVVLGGELRGVGTVIHLQSGDLEIYEASVTSADPASPPATSARLILDSRLLARATLFDSGSLFVSGGAEAWLDRCVLDAGPRMLVQSQENGRLFVRESLLRGEGSGLFRVSSGILAGTVIDVPRDPLGRLPQSLQDGGLRVSPRFLHLVQEGQEVPPDMKLQAEPLGR
ncbi:hypothetical protein [Planctomycetes bacterium Poly30]|uniref:hypothetical protein n=1 Tax=Saltatorellus ferox TaxID=2528018 RepID=UPI00119CCA25